MAETAISSGGQGLRSLLYDGLYDALCSLDTGMSLAEESNEIIDAILPIVARHIFSSTDRIDELEREVAELRAAHQDVLRELADMRARARTVVEASLSTAYLAGAGEEGGR